MSYNFKSRTIKKISLYYIVLILVAIIIPITHYPRIYGTDAFQVMWMANALREGALFSENTWLIHPTSYFGMFPFSHRAIGVPMFLAFLINLLNFFSFGLFGLPEAILAFNIFLILIIYKSSRNLGNRLFEEEWSRFVFVAAILLSPNVIYDTTMTVSTRIIISIVMLVLINLNLKILSNDDNNKKSLFHMFILLLISTLVHEIWLATLTTIIIMIFVLIVRKSKKLLKWILLLILPISCFLLFIGLQFFYVDPQKIWSPFFDNSTLIGVSINLIIHYLLQGGLIIIFFPLGLIITLYKLNFLFKKNDSPIEKLSSENQLFFQNRFYIILFLIPFSFMLPSFYAIVIFLPFIIIYSVYGLIHIEKIITSYSKKLIKIFPLILFLLSVGFLIIYTEIYIKINLFYILLITGISISLFLLVFIINNYKNLKFKNIVFRNFKFNKEFSVIILTISILLFTAVTIRGRLTDIETSPYPWENRYLTDEEINIINYFQNEEINGLIYTDAGILIAERLAGVGFLPSFYDRTRDGKSLYYGFTTPFEVYQNTKFRLLSPNLDFLYLTNSRVKYSIRAFREFILNLNLTQKVDIDILILHEVQFIISIKDNFKPNSADQSVLIQSLPLNFNPVYSTQHLLVWKIY